MQSREKPVAKIRKLLRLGGTYYVSLPATFIKRNNLKAGDYLFVLTNHIVRVIPSLEDESSMGRINNE